MLFKSLPSTNVVIFYIIIIITFQKFSEPPIEGGVCHTHRGCWNIFQKRRKDFGPLELIFKGAENKNLGCRNLAVHRVVQIRNGMPHIQKTTPDKTINGNDYLFFYS